MVFIQHSGTCDGTDALLSTLVQMCLDPHYRTLQGFCHLFDKEWNFYRYFFLHVPKKFKFKFFNIFFFDFLLCCLTGLVTLGRPSWIPEK